MENRRKSVEEQINDYQQFLRYTAKEEEEMFKKWPDKEILITLFESCLWGMKGLQGHLALLEKQGRLNTEILCQKFFVDIDIQRLENFSLKRNYTNYDYTTLDSCIDGLERVTKLLTRLYSKEVGDSVDDDYIYERTIKKLTLLRDYVWKKVKKNSFFKKG